MSTTTKRPGALDRAVLQVIVEDTTGKLCMGCNRPSATVGVWTPTRRCLVEDMGLDGDQARTVVYPFCVLCAMRSQREPGFIGMIERRLIESLRADGELRPATSATNATR
jgi:hypothetical protein